MAWPCVRPPEPGPTTRLSRQACEATAPRPRGWGSLDVSAPPRRPGPPSERAPAHQALRSSEWGGRPPSPQAVLSSGAARPRLCAASHALSGGAFGACRRPGGPQGHLPLAGWEEAGMVRPRGEGPGALGEEAPHSHGWPPGPQLLGLSGRHGVSIREVSRCRSPELIGQSSGFPGNRLPAPWQLEARSLHGRSAAEGRPREPCERVPGFPQRGAFP